MVNDDGFSHVKQPVTEKDLELNQSLITDFVKRTVFN